MLTCKSLTHRVSCNMKLAWMTTLLVRESIQYCLSARFASPRPYSTCRASVASTSVHTPQFWTTFVPSGEGTLVPTSPLQHCGWRCSMRQSVAYVRSSYNFPNRSGRWLKCITMRFLQFVSFQGKCIVLAYNEMNTRTHVSRHSSLFLFSSLFGPINVRCDLLFVHITLITLCIRKIDDWLNQRPPMICSLCSKNRFQGRCLHSSSQQKDLLRL